jgi:DNA N-6-adenine-methyltransferase Dam
MGQDRGMGGHSLPNEGATDTWLTPPHVLKALGPFDLDPCAAPSPRPWPTAARHIELPEDGLNARWEGRIWLNPPYGEATGLWVSKLAEHGRGIALIFARTETEFFQKSIFPAASGYLFLAGRLFFHFPDGKKAPANSGAPSVLVSFGMDDFLALIRAQESGSLPGALFGAARHTERFGFLPLKV